MRTLRFLLGKEFRQIFRNKSILAMVMVMPVVQLILLPLAANYEIKNINIVVADNDHSAYSSKLIHTITASGYFRLVDNSSSYADALKLIESDKADIILEIPSSFERNFIREGHQQLFVAVNAINGVKGNLGGAYLQTIIRSFNEDIAFEWRQPGANAQAAVISTTNSNWFNPLMNYKVFMVPGILALLVTMIGGFLSSLNIVKEKEAGTIEQINVTPIKKHHFILGKLIPFWILGMIVFSIGLIVARLVYGIIPVGSLLLLYVFIALYLLGILGFGLLISTFCETQQQAMFIMFFFQMVFILMGGLFTPIESMPDWAKAVTSFNPVAYLINVMRMVILKGSSWKDILPSIEVMAVFAVILNSWAVWSYRKKA